MTPDELRLRSLGVHLDAPIPEPAPASRMSAGGWARLIADFNKASTLMREDYHQLVEQRDTLAETCRRLHREMWEHERREWSRAVLAVGIGIVAGFAVKAILDWIWRF